MVKYMLLYQFVLNKDLYSRSQKVTFTLTKICPGCQILKSENQQKGRFERGSCPESIRLIQGNEYWFRIETTQILAFNFSRSKAEIAHFRKVQITYRNIAFWGLDFIAYYSCKIFNNGIVCSYTICCICAFLQYPFSKGNNFWSYNKINKYTNKNNGRTYN